MPRLIPNQEGAKDLHYTIVTIGAFVDPAPAGELSPPLLEHDRQAVDDLTVAIHNLQQETTLPDEENVLRTDDVIPLIAAQVTRIVGGGIKGRLRRQEAGGFLQSVLATANFLGQEPYRYDPSLPHDLPYHLQQFVLQKHPRFGRLSRSIAKIVDA